MEQKQNLKYKILKKTNLSKTEFENLALLYKNIFKPAPWNYDCNISRAKADLHLLMRYKTKIIRELVVEKNIIGFSFMVKRERAIKFSNGKEIKGWHLADLGILNDYHGLGFGSILLKETIIVLKQFNSDFFFFKTLNKQMVKLAEKFAEISVLSKVEDFKRRNYYYYLAKIQ